MPLEEKNRAVIQRMIDAGESEETIASVVRHIASLAKPSARDDLDKMGVDPIAGRTSDPLGPMLPTSDAVIDALPTIGGTVGGIVGAAGGPVPSIALASLLGAGGEGFRQAINAGRGRYEDVPESAGGRLKQVGAQGAVQGAAEGIGHGTAAALKPIAKVAYGAAMRPVKWMRDKYGLNNMLESGLKHRIFPTAGGAQKARGLNAGLKAERTGMAQAYDAGGGAPIDLQRAGTRGLEPIMERSRGGAAATGAPDQTEFVLDRLRRVIAAEGPTASAERTLQLGRSADELSIPAYKQAARTGINVPDVSDAGLAKGFGKGYRGELVDALGPDFAKKGADARTLYGVGEAAERMGGEQNILTKVATGALMAGTAATGEGPGNTVTAGAIMHALLNPRAQASAAFALPVIGRYGPRAIDAATGSNMSLSARRALIDLMSGHKEQP